MDPVAVQVTQIVIPQAAACPSNHNMATGSEPELRNMFGLYWKYTGHDYQQSLYLD